MSPCTGRVHDILVKATNQAWPGSQMHTMDFTEISIYIYIHVVNEITWNITYIIYIYVILSYIISIKLDRHSYQKPAVKVDAIHAKACDFHTFKLRLFSLNPATDMEDWLQNCKTQRFLSATTSKYIRQTSIIWG